MKSEQSFTERVRGARRVKIAIEVYRGCVLICDRFMRGAHGSDEVTDLLGECFDLGPLHALSTTLATGRYGPRRWRFDLGPLHALSKYEGKRAAAVVGGVLICDRFMRGALVNGNLESFKLARVFGSVTASCVEHIETVDCRCINPHCVLICDRFMRGAQNGVLEYVSSSSCFDLGPLHALGVSIFVLGFPFVDGNQSYCWAQETWGRVGKKYPLERAIVCEPESGQAGKELAPCMKIDGYW